MKRKTLVIVAIIVIAVILVGIGIYAATRGGGTTTSTTTATPTTSPSASGTATPAPTSTTTGVGGASSMQFTETLTNSSGASLGTYTYYAKDIGTSNLMIRIELTNIPGSSDMVYIVNGALQQAWLETGGQWTDMSSAFASNWSSWNSTFVGIKDNLTGWAGTGEYTYSDPQGDSVRISNIAVNPTLADSLFTH
ncbi:MAG: hypothetical protein ABSA75_13330 [Candidatus Bathyarchaeia archaeon]|jgi:hypothetical protein